jgi:hypothetical protein
MRYEQTVYNHMSTNQLADYWGISGRTLERWRGIGYGPHFVKVGGRVLYRVEDILEYESSHLADSTKSLVQHKDSKKPIAKPANVPQTTRRPEQAEPDWSPITAEVQEGLLIFEIPSDFRCNGGDLEFCLMDGELRLRPTRMLLGEALRLAVGK